MIDLKYCRNCKHWRDTLQWRGNCSEHTWQHDKYSEDACASGCPDYRDKQMAYTERGRGIPAPTL